MNLEDQIAQITNSQEFTRLCNSIFTRLYGEDFQVTDGTCSDLGIDGYLRSEEMVLAYYCPTKPENRTGRDYLKKITSDIQKASNVRTKIKIKHWRFVTPSKLTTKLIAEIDQLGKQHGFEIADHIESTFLADVLCKNTDLLASFPSIYAPHIKYSQQKLLKSYNEVMEIEAENIHPLLDWPILNDIKSGEKSEVYFDNEKLHEINDTLINPENRRILLKGIGGRGKTVLSRLFAYRKKQKSWQVYFIDIREVGNSETTVEKVIEEINNTLVSCDVSSLYIFENANLYDETTRILVKNVDNIVNNYIKSHFIFTSRDLVKDDDLSPFDNWKRIGLLSLISPNDILVEKIVIKYIQANKLQYTLTQADRDWMKATITPVGTSETFGTGGDLRLLRLFLIAWKYNLNSNLCDLQDQDIIKSLKKFLLTDELSGNPALADLLGKVSSIFQFDVPFYGKRADWSNSRDYLIDLKTLMEKGKIKFIGTDFYTLTHSRDAYYITRCLADHQRQSHSDYTGYKIVEYISELPDQPANIVIDNLVQLFNAFHHNSSNFKKDVFCFIFCNARNRILELISEFCDGLGIHGIKYHEGLGTLFRVLNNVDDYLGKNEAYAFWRKARSNIKTDVWEEILLRNRPFYIEKLIELINRISPDDELENDRFIFLSSNFSEIYKGSDLHRLNGIFKNLPYSTMRLLQDKMEPHTFASKILESKPIYLEFMIKQLEDDFMQCVFTDINQNKWNAFVIFLKKFYKGKEYPKNLVERILAIEKIDNEFVDTLRKILKSITIPVHRDNDGIVTINNSTANDYSNNKFSDSHFRKYLSKNFGGNFICTINNEKILYRLIKKIYDSTYSYSEKEQGSEIIGQIIYQLSDDVIKECCMNQKLLDVIEVTNKDAHKYLCKKCIEIL